MVIAGHNHSQAIAPIGAESSSPVSSEGTGVESGFCGAQATFGKSVAVGLDSILDFGSNVEVGSWVSVGGVDVVVGSWVGVGGTDVGVGSWVGVGGTDVGVGGISVGLDVGGIDVEVA